jgi:hypothetical protein
MSKTPKRRKIKNLMSKSINVFRGRKALDEITYTESPLEADLCYHFEYDTKITSYQAQPLSFEYFFEGSTHFYSPDFEVFYDDKTVSYVEVKFIADIARIANFNEWEKAVRKGASKKGRGFIVLKEDFIRQQPLYENLLNLWSAVGITINTEFLTHLIVFLDKNHEASISALMADELSDNEFEQIYRLIFERKLAVSLTQDFLSKSTIVKHSGESYDCYL